MDEQRIEAAANELPIGEIDDGILGVVLTLHNAGVKTFSSCQGGGYGWGHGYLRPTVCFDGDDDEGERAERIATEAGYQVFQVNRVWYARDGERVGPIWEMEFVAGAACRATEARAAYPHLAQDERLRKRVMQAIHRFQDIHSWSIQQHKNIGESRNRLIGEIEGSVEAVFNAALAAPLPEGERDGFICAACKR